MYTYLQLITITNYHYHNTVVLTVHSQDALPYLQSFDLDLNNGTITLTYNTEVTPNRRPAVVTIHERADSAATNRTLSLYFASLIENTVHQVNLIMSDWNAIRTFSVDRNSTFLTAESENVFAMDNEKDWTLYSSAVNSYLQVNMYTPPPPPELVRFSLDMNTGTLNLSFTQPVTTKPNLVTGITLLNQNLSLSVVFYSLTSGNVSYGDSLDPFSLEIVIFLSCNDSIQLQASPRLAADRETTFISIASGIVCDNAGKLSLEISNTSVMQASSYVPDTTPPLLLSFDLDLDTNQLMLTFDKYVNLSMSAMLFVNSGMVFGGIALQSDPNATRFTERVSVLIISFAMNTSVISFYLDLDRVKEIRSQGLAFEYNSTFLVLGSGVVLDANSNPNIPILSTDAVPVHSLTPDTTSPVLVSFALDLNDYKLVLTFSEPVSITPSILGGITLLLDESGSTNVSFVSETVLRDVRIYDDKVSLNFTSSVLAELYFLSEDISNTFLTCVEGIASDFSDNPSPPITNIFPLRASQIILDSTPPSVLYFQLDFNNGSIILTFSEHVKLNTLCPVPPNITIVSNLTMPRFYTVQPVCANDTFFPGIPATIRVGILYLREMDLDYLKVSFTGVMLSDIENETFYTIDEGIVTDLAGNPSTNMSYLPVSSVVSDMTPPSLTEFSFDLNTGMLELSFDEPVISTSHNLQRIILQSASHEPTFMYILLPVQVSLNRSFHRVIWLNISNEDLNTIKVNRDIATSPNNTYLSLLIGIVKDTSSNHSPVTSPLMASSVIPDMVPPRLVTAVLYDDYLNLTFSEPVDVSTVDVSALTLQSKATNLDSTLLPENATFVSYSLTAGSSTPSADSSIIVIILSTQDLISIVTLREDLSAHDGNIYLSYPSFLVTDISGNYIISSTVALDNVTINTVVCREERDPMWNILWSATLLGYTDVKPCNEDGSAGLATRRCSSDTGQWEEPDVTNCSNFQEIENNNILLASMLVNITGNRTSPTPIDPLEKSLIQNNTESLLNSTDIEQRNTTLFPRDLNATNVFLDIASRYSTSTDLLQQEESIAEDILTIASNILDPGYNPQWEVLSNDEYSTGAPLLLRSVETLAVSFAYSSSTSNQSSLSENDVTFSAPRLSLQATQVSPSSAGTGGISYDDVIYPIMKDFPNIPATFGSPDKLPQIEIPRELLEKRAVNDTDPVIVVNTLFSNLQLILPRTFANGSSIGNLTISPVILSGQVADIRGTSAALKNRRVNLTFSIEENYTAVHCAFYDFEGYTQVSLNNSVIGGWSSEGLSQGKRDGRVLCQSEHLTSFVILVDYTGVIADKVDSEMDLLFTILSTVGCGISILCLIASIIFFLSLGKDLINNTVHFVHLNLCLALLCGLGLYLAVSVLGYEGQFSNKAGCSSLTALLHYFLLAAFCWMLCEGLMMYVLLVRVFGAHEKKWLAMYLIIGWGLPLIPLVVTIGVAFGTGLDYFIVTSTGRVICWLSQENYFIWTFLVPMIVVILLNVVILVRVMYTIVKSQHSRLRQTYSQKRNRLLLRHTLYSFMALLPLMGGTWLFGLLAANDFSEALHVIFSWLFVVCNTLQGCAVFLFHVVRHEKNWNRIKSFVNKRLKVKSKPPASQLKDLTASKQQGDDSTLKTSILSTGTSTLQTKTSSGAEGFDSSIYTSDTWDVPLLDTGAEDIKKRWNVIQEASDLLEQDKF